MPVAWDSTNIFYFERLHRTPDVNRRRGLYCIPDAHIRHRDFGGTLAVGIFLRNRDQTHDINLVLQTFRDVQRPIAGMPKTDTSRFTEPRSHWDNQAEKAC